MTSNRSTSSHESMKTLSANMSNFKKIFYKGRNRITPYLTAVVGVAAVCEILEMVLCKDRKEKTVRELKFAQAALAKNRAQHIQTCNERQKGDVNDKMINNPAIDNLNNLLKYAKYVTLVKIGDVVKSTTSSPVSLKITEHITSPPSK